MEQRLSILTLGVSDLKTAEKFYIEVFGWEKSPMSQPTIIFLKMNGLLLSLYPLQKFKEEVNLDVKKEGFPTFTMAYNARSEAEVNILFEQFKERGAKILKMPEKVFWGGYSGYISDPDGYFWEIAFNPFLKLDEAGNIIE
ncbi:MAG: VOC family protein [Bacteroidetes bacterium]|jgi:predicted lactoylglutathione lyase|nr:VOC family protein [Bacteroidota bacterium]MDF1865602.1 VOC family protein [Saprospiraceae bacterium]